MLAEYESVQDLNHHAKDVPLTRTFRDIVICSPDLTVERMVSTVRLVRAKLWFAFTSHVRQKEAG